jgi:hypothetical protein
MILLLGSDGSIGKRYTAVLKDLDIPYIGWDKATATNYWQDLSFDKAIVATPTDTHFDICNKLIDLQKPFLCEKPLSKNQNECDHLVRRAKTYGVKGAVVCNYKFVCPEEKIRSIEYDSYYTGGDGFAWDLCQIIYLAFQNNARLHLRNKSPVWSMRINDEAVSLRDVHWSYVDMLHAFSNNEWDSLWSLYDGFEMTKAVDRFVREKKYE